MSKANQARDNRLLMPECTKFIDSVRDVFGDGVKVIYASENNMTFDSRAAADAHRKAEIEARK